jgi:hypothetical protein
MKHFKNYNSIDIFRLVFGVIIFSMAITVVVHIINNGATF